MKSRLALTLTCLVALSGAACSDDNDAPVKPLGDSSVPDSGGGSRPDAGSDAGPPAVPPDSGPPVTTLSLVQYVDDLIDNHTDDTSAPDDVASKTLTGTEDPAAFDKRFK